VTRILITGFGPFPGQPTNPSMRLARHAGTVKRIGFAGVERIVRLLPTTWAVLDGVSAMLAETRPDVVLMFGVASRRRKVTPEARALNHQSGLKPDADKRFAGPRSRVAGAPAALPSSFDAHRLQAAIQGAGAPVAVSRNAGTYLCNALSWHVLASGLPAVFVHVPRPRRMQRRKGQEKRPRPTMRQLERAAEAALGFVLASRRR
jgi:pyroglutamyl-peptidase